MHETHIHTTHTYHTYTQEAVFWPSKDIDGLDVRAANITLAALCFDETNEFEFFEPCLKQRPNGAYSDDMSHIHEAVHLLKQSEIAAQDAQMQATQLVEETSKRLEELNASKR